MEDYRGRRIQEASPAQPVEITGFNGMPDVSDSLRVVESETVAKSVAADRALRKRQAVQSVGRKPTLEELLAKAVASEVKELLIVLRADVVGSVAAVKEALEKLENEEGVKVRVIFSGTGTITESDINFASASGAVVVGFHVRPPATVVRLAQDEGIEIRLYSIIYKALEDMQDILNGMLTPKFAETTIGSVEVRAIFSVPKLGKVAGCYVTEGTVARNAEVRLIRDGVEKYIGKCTSLRRFKEDAKEVKQGFECGIRLENWQDVQEKDIIEFFRNEEIKA
jgi:translation initiation factor IF-2